MSAVSNVTVVPDYNTSNQSIALSNEATAEAITANATSNTAVANSQFAISKKPFSTSSLYTTPFSLTGTFAPITTMSFLASNGSAKMIIWAYISVQDTSGGTSVRFFLRCNTSPAQDSLTVAMNLSNTTGLVPIIFSPVGYTVPSFVSITLYGLATNGATMTSVQLIGLINT